MVFISKSSELEKCSNPYFTEKGIEASRLNMSWLCKILW